MAQKIKKAKLAHEKKKAGGPKDKFGGFTFKSVVDIVDWQGNDVAVVDLDGEGTLAIVARHFVAPKPDGSGFESSGLACPAVYDEAARGRAVQRHDAWKSASA